MKIIRISWVCLMVAALWFSTVLGVKIPENSDFVLHIASIEKMLGDFLADYNTEIGSITLFGKDSLGGTFEILMGIAEEDEETLIKALSKLPISITIDPKFSEDILAKSLADMLETSYIITNISKEEKKIQIDKFTFYTLRSKDALYITFSETQKRMIADMQNGKLKTVDVQIPADVDIYYKNFGTSPIGNLLYLFGDFYGRPTSEELKVSFNDDRLYFELSITKNVSEYEKNLLKESEFYLSELNYAENSKLMFGATKGLPLLSLIISQEFPEEFTKLLSNGIDSILISGDSDLFISAKYRIEYEKVIESTLREYFQSIEFDRTNSILNAWQGEEVKSKTKRAELENSLMYLYMSEQEDMEFVGITFNVQRSSEGGLIITGSVSNFKTYLEKILFDFLNEPTEEYYDEYESEDWWEDEEWEESEEYTEEEYEEEYTEECTTEEIEEETYEEETYEEEVFDEEYVYSTAENLANVVDYLIEKLNSGLIPTQWALQYDYPYSFLNRLEFFPAIGKDGTKYLTIVFELPSEEIGEAIISILEEYGISAWMAYGKLIINYVIQKEYAQ